MLSWWHRDVIAAGKLPLMLCFVSFVVTFVSTRTITRLIRDGRGPFRNVTAGGTHVHHSVPGIILLMIGAFTAVGGPARWAGCRSPRSLVGFSPLRVPDMGSAERLLRISATGLLVIDACLALVCILKGKYRTGLFGLFLPPVGLFGAVRLARPNSIWARRRYHGERLERATRRAADFDRHWKPVQADWEDFIGGRPSQPDPPRSPDPPPSPAQPPAGAADG